MNDKKAKQESRKTGNLLGNTITINDLREKEFNGEILKDEERKALRNFEEYRLNELNNQSNESSFHNKYIQLQVMANLSPFEEFLNDKYYS